MRLAPTPSGFLHIGNALNFTLNWLAAKACGGSPMKGSFASLFLRIDDLDNDRTRPEYLADIFETLQWLKLDWDADPIFQSNNVQRYDLVLNDLHQRGMLFACKKSRQELAAFEGQYPLEFREQNLSLDAPDVAWRIKTPPGFSLPDFVVRRRDGIPAYQIASFADDLFYGTTHIIRGEDLKDSTMAQWYLANVLKEDRFLNVKFIHHPLLLDEDGKKLSKSAGSMALKTVRDKGLGPEIVFQTLGKWIGLEGDSSKELLDAMQQKLR
ncbi:MAG: glutamate--tRNA ligase family protein [Saprospiraceae bacterium]